MSSEEDRKITLAAMGFLYPGVTFRFAQLDGVDVIFAPVADVAAAARREVAAIEAEEGAGG